MLLFWIKLRKYTHLGSFLLTIWPISSFFWGVFRRLSQLSTEGLFYFIARFYPSLNSIQCLVERSNSQRPSVKHNTAHLLRQSRLTWYAYIKLFDRFLESWVWHACGPNGFPTSLLTTFLGYGYSWAVLFGAGKHAPSFENDSSEDSEVKAGVNMNRKEIWGKNC